MIALISPGSPLLRVGRDEYSVVANRCLIVDVDTDARAIDASLALALSCLRSVAFGQDRRRRT